MRTRLTLFFGIFAVMALSNAIVPVLPSYAGTSSMQGAIYSAYFFGAFLSTLPAGILSDRYGRVPILRIGLGITFATGILLSVMVSPFPVIIIRVLEGVGAGFFAAAAMSYVNSLPDHEKMSGYFMASLNAGLVIGLVIPGWLATNLHNPASGILLFTGLCLIPSVAGIFIHETFPVARTGNLSPVLNLVKDYRWLWYSSVVLIGITGIVTSLYPKYFRLLSRKCRILDFFNEYCNYCRGPGCIASLITSSADNPLVSPVDADRCIHYIFLAVWLCDNWSICGYCNDIPDGFSCACQGSPGCRHGTVLNLFLSGDGSYFLSSPV